VKIKIRYIILSLLQIFVSISSFSQVSIKLLIANGIRKEIMLDSILTIPKSDMNSKALKAISFPDIKEKDFTGFEGTVEYDFVFTSTNLVSTKLVNGFSSYMFHYLDVTKKTDKLDSILFKEHEHIFNKVKKYLRLEAGKTYVMSIKIKFEWDEKNDKSIDADRFLIDKKWQLKGMHDKNAKC
jgi:hypothetical protein